MITGTSDKKAAMPVYVAAGMAFLCITLLFAMILAFALPVFMQKGGGGVFTWNWQPNQGEFGILPMLTGSLLLSFSTLLLAWPLSLAVCCWTLDRRPGLLRSLVQGLLRFMTAIPTVVYGFAAVFLLTPLIRSGLGGSGMCWLAAALMLTLLILPTMTLILEAGLKPRLEGLCPGGLALGFTRLELLWFFILPLSRKTLVAAALLGFGRAIGDTLLPLMLAGNAPQVPGGLLESLRTLTAHMALVTSNEVGGLAYNSLFMAGALLLIINAIVSLAARRMEKSLGESPNKHVFWMPDVKRSVLFLFMREGARFAVLLVFLCIATMVAFLLVNGVPVLGSKLLFGDTPPLDAILGTRPVWDGLWPALVGTLCLMALTICIALFPGIGCGIFLAAYAGPRWKRIMGNAVDMLAGTPSIVMGLFGFTLILFLRRTFFPDANTCLLLAACCLAILVLPVLIVSTREALEAVPEHLRLTASSLGMTKEQYLWRVALPAASRGIWSGVILAVGRSAEDTAVIMLTGVVVNAGLPAGISAKFEALPFAIYYIAAQYQTQEELMLGFGAALLLLILASGMLLTARGIEAGYQRRWMGIQ